MTTKEGTKVEATDVKTETEDGKVLTATDVTGLGDKANVAEVRSNPLPSYSGLVADLVAMDELAREQGTTLVNLLADVLNRSSGHDVRPKAPPVEG
jgi:hypothetical protein